MKKSYVTTVPDHIGAFLKASECFSDLGINIIRVSYNKAVDSHTIFIDAEGPEDKLSEADRRLEEIGYLQRTSESPTVLLLEFTLPDVPGTVTEVLRLITEFGINISYISSQQDGSDVQHFKMGLFVDDASKVSEFLKQAEEICPVKIIDYNQAGVVYDNSIFYSSFVTGITKSMDISGEKREELLVYSNLAMQSLDERGLSPYHTFDSISKLADFLAVCKGSAFVSRITYNKITEDSDIVLIEPPCGSNTAILRSKGEVLFVDTGYACYKEEMTKIITDILPDFESMVKDVIITHADLDHIGLCPMFDHVYASENSARCMRMEYEGDNGFREVNPLHKPYVKICKILTSFEPVPTDKVVPLWNARPENDVPLYPVGFFDFGEFHFEVYEGMGGHLKGEIVMIDYGNHVAFTGDIYVNIHGMTAGQARYNKYAPALMTSVDTDPDICRREREAVFDRLGSGEWKIFGGHGGVMEYRIGQQ